MQLHDQGPSSLYLERRFLKTSKSDFYFSSQACKYFITTFIFEVQLEDGEKSAIIVVFFLKIPLESELHFYWTQP